MATDPNKTVFISYRRSASRHLARSIFMDLTQQGYDVFLDVNTIDSGAFDSIILNQIGARTHFVILLSPTALKRCVNDTDWLRREIEEAMRLGRNIVPLIEEGFDFERETGYLPAEWRDQFRRLSGMRLLHDYFEEGMTKLRDRFLKPPQFRVELKTVSTQEQREVQQRIAQVVNETPKIVTPPKPKITLPQPFDWCYVPAGKVSFSQKDGYDNDFYAKSDMTMDVPEFYMAKYPITNAQFRPFIQDGGYKTDSFWTSAGLDWRNRNKRIQPYYWEDSEWNGDDYPVVGISWYEAVAFCQWMSNKTSEKIMLPTDAMWQRAAQGDDGRKYPWGNTWDASLSNNNVDKKGIGKTTPVRQYESKYNSLYGVVDMTGNVWEWCLTTYKTGENRVKGTDADLRVLMGGSWYTEEAGRFVSACRNWGNPSLGFNYFRGFRLARFYNSEFLIS